MGVVSVCIVLYNYLKKSREGREATGSGETEG